MNAKTRGLDSADGQARSPPRRAFASFFFKRTSRLKEGRKRKRTMPDRHASWGELLRDAVEKPGRLLEAYTAFHNYSFGNALLALEQCIKRNLQSGPLNTYRGWLEKARQVRKGEKGITLCMPMPFKRPAQSDDAHDETAEPQTCYAFRFRAYWFVLAQTEGEEMYVPPIPGFDIDIALRALNISHSMGASSY
jgi:N-terminal domain of anti-restriction factor ArdC